MEYQKLPGTKKVINMVFSYCPWKSENLTKSFVEKREILPYTIYPYACPKNSHFEKKLFPDFLVLILFSSQLFIKWLNDYFQNCSGPLKIIIHLNSPGIGNMSYTEIGPLILLLIVVQIGQNVPLIHPSSFLNFLR